MAGNSVGSCLSALLLPMLLAAAGYTALVHQLQEKLIYMPRTYDTHAQHYHRARQRAHAALSSIGQGGGIHLIKYALPGQHQETQTAYLLSPGYSILKGGFDLWITAGGNAGLALDWLDIAGKFMQKRHDKATTQTRPAVFFLIDYPGYGTNLGEPFPHTMLDGNRAALSALDKHLAKYNGDSVNTYKINYLAHSIGCSVALAHAATVLEDNTDHHQIDRLVLVAPFTTMIDMAKRTLPIPIPGIQHLLRHPFDNTLQLSRIADALQNRKRATISITIAHGDRDNIVPVAMGRQIATLGKTFAKSMKPDVNLNVRYLELPGQGHNQILHHASTIIINAMEATL